MATNGETCKNEQTQSDNIAPESVQVHDRPLIGTSTSKKPKNLRKFAHKTFEPKRHAS